MLAGATVVVLLSLAGGVVADPPAPSASIGHCPGTVRVGDPAAFSSSGSSGGSGPDKRASLSFSWSFGDGSTSTEANPLHAYTAAGPYVVTLTVADSSGTSAPAICMVTATDPPPAAPPPAANTPPTADFSWTQSVANVSAEVSFRASAHDSDGRVSSYSWDFGDGASGTGRRVTHTYTTDGSHTVTLTVTDNAGATTSASHAVETHAGPTATITTCPTTAQVNAALAFGGSATPMAGSTIASLGWDFGDGTTAAGANPSHTYTSAGDMQVKLAATDSNGIAGVPATCLVHVTAPAPPAPDPPARLQVISGVRVTIAGTLSGGKTTITRLTVRAPAGASIRVQCSQPQRTRAGTAPRLRSCGIRAGRFQSAGRAMRVHALERSYRARARINVIVSKRGFISSVTSFTMRAGRQPLRQALCLRPGSKTPGSCPLS